jgi:hypothetical protein
MEAAPISDEMIQGSSKVPMIQLGGFWEASFRNPGIKDSLTSPIDEFE